VLRNELLNRLRDQDAPAEGLTDVLIALYRDRAQEPALRHYALQHMALWYERPAESQQKQITEVLWEATGEMESGLAGTALLSLLRVAQQSGESDNARLAGTALRLASDDQTDTRARITAVQVCGRLRVSEATPLCGEIARSAASVPLRVAAIATLGDVGGNESENVLQEFDTGSDPRVAVAVRAALSRIEQRADR
jgi:HEAT repeat protein